MLKFLVSVIADVYTEPLTPASATRMKKINVEIIIQNVEKKKNQHKYDYQ